MATCCWSDLPTVVLYDLFRNLSLNDRIRASSTCKKWREAFFYYPSWRKLKLLTFPHLSERNRFFASKASYFCKELTIVYAKNEYKELIELLECFPDSAAIRDLQIVGSGVPELPSFKTDFNDVVYPFLEKCLHITSLFISHWVNPERMKRLLTKHAKTLTALGLEDISPSEGFIEPMLISVLNQCDKIKHIRIDGNWLNVDLMKMISDSNSLPNLEKLGLFLTAKNNMDTKFSREDWLNFKQAHPHCQIYLHYMHIKDVNKVDMVFHANNVTHLRFFFCSEEFEADCLERSMVYQSFCNSLISIWSFFHPDNERDSSNLSKSLLLCAWRYMNLSEIYLGGAKFESYDLIGMTRLRPKLQIYIDHKDIMIDTERNILPTEVNSLEMDLPMLPLASCCGTPGGTNNLQSTLSMDEREVLALIKALQYDMP